MRRGIQTQGSKAPNHYVESMGKHLYTEQLTVNDNLQYKDHTE